MPTGKKPCCLIIAPTDKRLPTVKMRFHRFCIENPVYRPKVRELLSHLDDDTPRGRRPANRSHSRGDNALAAKFTLQWVSTACVCGGDILFSRNCCEWSWRRRRCKWPKKWFFMAPSSPVAGPSSHDKRKPVASNRRAQVTRCSKKSLK